MSLLYGWSLSWTPQPLAIGGAEESSVNTWPAPWQLQKKCPDVLNWIRYSQRAQMISENQTLHFCSAELFNTYLDFPGLLTTVFIFTAHKNIPGTFKTN